MTDNTESKVNEGKISKFLLDSYVDRTFESQLYFITYILY